MIRKRKNRRLPFVCKPLKYEYEEIFLSIFNSLIILKANGGLIEKNEVKIFDLTASRAACVVRIVW